MRLATIRTGGRTVAVRIDPDAAVEVSAPDVGSLLAHPDWRQIAASAAGTRHPVHSLDYAPLLPKPDKIICVGLNYSEHISETGHDRVGHPTLFSKYSTSLVGANDEVLLPASSSAVDWEVELAAVIGKPGRYIRVGEVSEYLSGFCVANDVSVRDWQYRTSQFLQGKTFDNTTPLGPWLVTLDDPDITERSFELTCEVDGEIVQSGSTSDMMFDVPTLVSYVSEIVTLQPGDVILTGTPSGVGWGRDPKVFLRDGSVMVTKISGLGECRNVCRAERLISSS